jgi:sugar phosphate isomerase/epimerase
MSATLTVQPFSIRDALATNRPATLKQLADLGYRYVEPFTLWNTTPEERFAAARLIRADVDAAGLSVCSHHVAIGADGPVGDAAHLTRDRRTILDAGYTAPDRPRRA